MEELTTSPCSGPRAWAGMSWRPCSPKSPNVPVGLRAWPCACFKRAIECAVAKGEQTITQDHLRLACDLEGIDELGLGPTERKYLAILAQGPVRLNVIASLLGLPPRTVSPGHGAIPRACGLGHEGRSRDGGN